MVKAKQHAGKRLVALESLALKQASTAAAQSLVGGKTALKACTCGGRPLFQVLNPDPESNPGGTINEPRLIDKQVRGESCEGRDQHYTLTWGIEARLQKFIRNQARASVERERKEWLHVIAWQGAGGRDGGQLEVCMLRQL